MRVGVIGPLEPDTFAENLVDCLPDLGVEAVALGSCRRGFRERRAASVTHALASGFPPLDTWLQKPILERALEADLDLIISVEGLLMASVVQQFRSAGIKTALWFPDAVSNLGVLRMMAAPYSRLYFKDSLLVERLSATYGLPVSYLPEACNPRWHRPIGEPGADATVVVAGNLYVTRIHLLNRMASDHIPVRLYGPGWPRVVPPGAATSLDVQPAVHREVKSQVFRQSAAVLNNLHPAEMTSVNCRLFEATAAGGAVLCEDRAALDELFDVGSEVLSFKTYEQLLAHARRLIEEPDLSRAIGDAAALRARAEHTYQIRLETILSDLA